MVLLKSQSRFASRPYARLSQISDLVKATVNGAAQIADRDLQADLMQGFPKSDLVKATVSGAAQIAVAICKQTLCKAFLNL